MPNALSAVAAATADLDPPLAALDADALAANAADLVHRAGGTPVRVASKSVRCRHVLATALATPGFAGVMAYSVREAIWLARSGVTDDVLVGYPSADRVALAELGEVPADRAAITIMIDDVEQLRFVRAATPARLRICLDVDASLRIGPAHLGVRRSPVRSPTAAARLATAATAAGFDVVGVMFYEAQIAGLPDSSRAVRLVKARSAHELAARRGTVVEAVRAALGCELEIVNGGGTGSIEITAADPVVTEVTAGSGLYFPTLFDGYRAFAARPALYFALPVVRRPARRIVTTFGGGYVASGPAGRSRLPQPAQRGLRLLGAEGAGEVQTPLRGRAAARLRIGDAIWFRPAKAGEVLERFDTVHVVRDGRRVETIPSYRGEGQNFG